jgi:hypothetical protein
MNTEFLQTVVTAVSYLSVTGLSIAMIADLMQG